MEKAKPKSDGLTAEQRLERNLVAISKKNMLFDTFEVKNSDRWDFLDCSKVCVKRALYEAYELGKKDGKASR